MFKDTSSGTTHSYNDGCGEPAHNKPEKWEEEFDRNFKYVFSEKDPIYGAENTQNKNAIKIFISHAISEAVEEETLRWTYMTSNEREHEAERILSSIQNNAIK